jgi:hypothetical protein
MVSPLEMGIFCVLILAVAGSKRFRPGKLDHVAPASGRPDLKRGEGRWLERFRCKSAV